ncbi:MAG: HAD hydrolase-like protein [Candidatus Omnitrophica bacterium]|nr:HAD hydrolase-like protein [Candidatus Omnitrophota bacterium]
MARKKIKIPKAKIPKAYPPETKSPRRKRPAIDGIIFDIDNVLIDTRYSYLDAIRWTIEVYLTSGTIPFFVPTQKCRTPQLLTPQHVDQFKLLGGFNDDWDCCYGLLIYLLQLPIRGRTIKDLKSVINLTRFSKEVQKRPLRASGIVDILGYNPAVKIEKIARIFQEIYLGRDLFQIVEKKRPVYWKKLGLLHKEKLVFRKSTLKKLQARGIRLGIATGRPRFEAVYALKRFGILDLFDEITTMDEVKRAERHLKQSLRKPNPFSIVETAKKMQGASTFLYIGDLPDDILAAREAKNSIDIYAVGFPRFAANPKSAAEELKTANPDFMIYKPSDLMALAKPKVKA